MGIWESITRWTRTHRIISITLAVLITAICISIAPSIDFSADATQYLPQDNENVAFWLEKTNNYGGFDILMIGLEEPGKPLQSDSLMRLARISDRLTQAKAEGILWVRSLANIPTVHEAPNGTLNNEMLVNAIPRTPKAREDLAKRILRDTQAPGSLVSLDLKGYVIMLRADKRKDMRKTARFVQNLVEEERGDMKAYFFGAPFVAIQITNKIYRMLPWMIPLFLLGLFIVLRMRVRHIRTSAIIIGSTGVAILWWFGLLTIFGIELSSTGLNGVFSVLVAGSILFGSGAELWLRRDPKDTPPSPFPVRLGLLALLGAVAFGLLSQLTGSFLTDFALASAFGLVAVLLVGLLLFPALIGMLAPAPRFSQSGSANTGMFSGKARGILIAVLLIVGFVGAPNMRFFINLQDMFSSRDEIGAAVDFFERKLGGADFLQINIKADLRDPETMRRIMCLSDLLEGNGHFADIRSISQIVGFLAENFGGIHRIPDERDALDNLWFFLEGNEDIRSFVLDDRSETMIVARIPGDPARQIDWAAEAQKTIDLSKAKGIEAARLRLQALVSRYKLAIDSNKINAILAAVNGKPSTSLDERESASLLEELHTFLLSDQAPFALAESDWETIKPLLTSDDSTIEKQLPQAISGLQSYIEMEYPPEVAKELSDTLIVRKAQIIQRVISERLVAELTKGLDANTIPGAFLQRAQGVMADYLAPIASNNPEIEFRITGFPALAGPVEEQMLNALYIQLFGLSLLLALVTLIALRSIRPALVILLACSLASLLALAFGWLFSIHSDSASSTLYILAPLATFLLSFRLLVPWDDESGTVRIIPTAFAIAFALGALSLLVTGVPPVMRLGAVMSDSLVVATLVSSLAIRFNNGNSNG